VVFAVSASATTAHPIRRGVAHHAAQAANANIIPGPYGRTTTEYSYTDQ
jgi:hypothetical protein